MIRACLLTITAMCAFGAAAASAAAQDRPARLADRVVRETIAEARAIARAYQGGATESEPFSRKVRLGRDGRVLVSNVSGDITVTAGSGEEVSIEAVKSTRGSRDDLARVDIEVDDRPGRLEIRTRYPNRSGNRVSVEFTLQVPSSTSVELHSVSGSVRVTNVLGTVRAESVSGTVTVNGSPRVEVAKSVSGNVELVGAAESGDLTASSVSGNVRARGVKARGLQLSSVSGNIVVSEVACERVEAKSVSGSIEYEGTLARSGRYDVNSHSGDVRIALSGSTGFELTATSFSGEIRSDLPVTLGASEPGDRRGRRGNRSIRATFGDASALLTVHTFSGDVVITRKQ